MRFAEYGDKMWGRLQRRRRLGRFERKCAPETLEIRPCKPLETNGGTDEQERNFGRAASEAGSSPRRLKPNAPSFFNLGVGWVRK
jgi:hypothetical protein